MTSSRSTESRAIAAFFSFSGPPSASNIMQALAMAGKMAPSPSLPFSRSLTKSTTLAMARRRSFAGGSLKVLRSAMSTPRKKAKIAGFWCGAFSAGRWSAAAARNSSSSVMPRGLTARGFSANSTKSGASTVRPQYEILVRWKGNHCGSSAISTGIIGTLSQSMMPNKASRMRVKTLTLTAPPRFEDRFARAAACAARRRRRRWS